MKEKIIFYSAIIILTIVVALDFFYIQKTNQVNGSLLNTVLEVGQPKFSIEYIFRTILIAVSIFLLILSVINPTLSELNFNKKIVGKTFFGWGKLFWIADSSSGKIIFSMKIKRLILWLLVFFYLFLLFLFYDRPGFFSKISLEDGLVENVSAIICFFCCGIFFYIFFILNSIKGKNRYLIKLLPIGLAVIFFIVGMEEISWFQRLFSLRTPQILEANDQGELNFHNLHTKLAENLYYFSAFTFLILIPFLYEHFHYRINIKTLKLFIPGRFILFASAIIVAYNYDQWNILIIQFCFFFTLFILGYYAWIFKKFKNEFILIFTLFIVVILTQVLFLIYGDQNFSREWEVKEYKELLIPLSFYFYAIEILVRVKRMKKKVVDQGINRVAFS